MSRVAGVPLRTGARKNRERILEVAKSAFTRFGANTSLDDIAKQAVGAGTLYRHFPTREELLEAVYRTEVEKLAAAERQFAEDLPSWEADPIDLPRALVGVANVATSPDWQQSAKRLVDILVTGSRLIKQAPALMFFVRNSERSRRFRNNQICW
ncbi:MAG: helix-turn-helix domain-containing protein [Bryobacteraceae bacterium]